MDDGKIIDLYFARDESAITETDKKYGAYCHSIAYGILNDGHDSDECVNDTYYRAWSAIPPSRPSIFSAFLARITRNLALDRIRRCSASKRGRPESLDELEGFVGDSSVSEEVEVRELGQIISAFLKSKDELTRLVFVRRYFYCDGIADIARRYRIGEARVKTLLFRVRLQLKEELTKRGIFL